MDASDEYLAELEEALEGMDDGSFAFNRNKPGHVEVVKLLAEKLQDEDNLLYLLR